MPIRLSRYQSMRVIQTTVLFLSSYLTTVWMLCMIRGSSGLCRPCVGRMRFSRLKTVLDGVLPNADHQRLIDAIAAPHDTVQTVIGKLVIDIPRSILYREHPYRWSEAMGNTKFVRVRQATAEGYVAHSFSSSSATYQTIPSLNFPLQDMGHIVLNRQQGKILIDTQSLLHSSLPLGTGELLRFLLSELHLHYEHSLADSNDIQPSIMDLYESPTVHWKTLSGETLMPVSASLAHRLALLHSKVAVSLFDHHHTPLSVPNNPNKSSPFLQLLPTLPALSTAVHVADVTGEEPLFSAVSRCVQSVIQMNLQRIDNELDESTSELEQVFADVDKRLITARKRQAKYLFNMECKKAHEDGLPVDAKNNLIERVKSIMESTKTTVTNPWFAVTKTEYKGRHGVLSSEVNCLIDEYAVTLSEKRATQIALSTATNDKQKLT